ncbi:MAG: hypothetical protein N4J56_005857 [Chroococcidiopsis sp. SAG 2025]|uniref:YdcF family protein n=1 Tax=Chroococcidiopsis sp. SAG 2025 TaxID=171389 RepID=UPI002936F98D|nr:YdcF family protein [Chroococcidiopsis sp. SAG 2025]MDV2996203.1 hypothetical protein [Chroococcidiopsis sp. SAG 2025]
MLDPALCARPLSQWLVLKSTLSHWLMTPVLVVIPLTAFILLIKFFPKWRWKRYMLVMGSLSLVAYFLASFPATVAIASKGLIAFLPEDPGRKADAIVILGRGAYMRKSRVEVAADLWKSKRAPLIFASGAGDGADIVNMLKTEGVPKSVLKAESCSQTTEENALFTAAMLQPMGVKRIVLITDSPHMMRSLLTFRSLGFTVFPRPTPLPANLPPTRRAMMIFYEYMGLFNYGIKGYWQPQNAEMEQNPYIAQQQAANG